MNLLRASSANFVAHSFLILSYKLFFSRCAGLVVCSPTSSLAQCNSRSENKSKACILPANEHSKSTGFPLELAPFLRKKILFLWIQFSFVSWLKKWFCCVFCLEVSCPLVFDIDRVIREKLSPTNYIGFSCRISDCSKLKLWKVPICLMFFNWRLFLDLSTILTAAVALSPPPQSEDASDAVRISWPSEQWVLADDFRRQRILPHTSFPLLG